jgi:hypothetical protein
MPFDATFHVSEFAGKLAVGGESLAELNKRPHDGNVDLDGAVTVEHAGKHGDALLRERVSRIAASTVTRT